VKKPSVLTGSGYHYGSAAKTGEVRGEIGSRAREVASSLSTTVAILTDLDPAASLQVQDILFEQAMLACASNIPRVGRVAPCSKYGDMAELMNRMAQMFGNQRIEFDEILDFSSEDLSRIL